MERRKDYISYLGFPKSIPITILFSIAPFFIGGMLAYSDLKTRVKILDEKSIAIYRLRDEDKKDSKEKIDRIENQVNKIFHIVLKHRF